MNSNPNQNAMQAMKKTLGAVMRLDEMTKAEQAVRQTIVKARLQQPEQAPNFTPAMQAKQDLVGNFQRKLTLLQAELYPLDDEAGLADALRQCLLRWQQADQSGLTQLRFTMSDALKDFGLTKDALSKLKPLHEESIMNLSPQALADWQVQKAAGEDSLLTMAEFAIAETGSLMVRSGANQPILDHYFCRNALVLLRHKDLLASLDDLWPAWRKRYGQGDEKLWPRNLNIISGASRTGDVGQKIELGAHGPLRLAVFLMP